MFLSVCVCLPSVSQLLVGFFVYFIYGNSCFLLLCFHAFISIFPSIFRSQFHSFPIFSTYSYYSIYNDYEVFRFSFFFFWFFFFLLIEVDGDFIFIFFSFESLNGNEDRVGQAHTEGNDRMMWLEGGVNGGKFANQFIAS